MKKIKLINCLTRVSTTSFFIKLILASVSFYLTSCSIYVPSTSNPVYIDKKNEIQVGGNISSSILGVDRFVPTIGVHGDIAYTFTDRLSAQITASRNLLSYNEIGVSVGYYQPITENLRIGLFPKFNYGSVFMKVTYWNAKGGVSYQRQWDGNYLLPCSRIQLFYKHRIVSYGIALESGLYMPNFTVNDFANSYVQQALLINPSAIIVIEPSEANFGITFNTSISNLFPIETGEIKFNESYSLDYNKLNLSFGFIFFLR